MMMLMAVVGVGLGVIQLSAGLCGSQVVTFTRSQEPIGRKTKRLRKFGAGIPR